MTITVNNVQVTVDEDMVTLNDPDEVASFAPFNGSLTAAVAAITGAAPTLDFTTTQFAAQDNFFTIGVNTTDLRFVADGGDPPTGFPVGGTNGVDSGLKTADGTSIYLFRSASTDNVVYGAIGNNAANPAAFTLALDEQLDGAGHVTNAKMWIIQYAAVLHDGQNVTEGDLVDLTNKVYVASTAFSQSVFSDFGDVPSGSPIFAMIADDTNANPVDYLVTGFDQTAPGTGTQLNVSNQGSFPGSLSTGSQNLGYGDGLRFDLVTDGFNGYTSAESQVDTNIAFNTHQTVVQAGFSIVQNQGARPTDLKIELWDSLSNTADGHNFFTSVLNQASVSIDKILVGIINPNTGVITPLWDSSNPAHASHFTVSGNAITVNDVLLNYEIEIFQDSGFDRFTATNVTTTLNHKGQVVPDTNATVDIGRLTFTSSQTLNDAQEVGSHIQIDDSGPTLAAIGTAPTFTVDESGLAAGTDSGNPGQTTDSHSVAANFSHTFGSDGPGTFTYAMTVVAGDSGLDDMGTGENILLRVNGSGVVEGYTAISDLIAFTVGVNSTGLVTLTELRAIKHDPGGLDEAKTMAADLIKVQATVVDAEGAATGDSLVASLSISDKLNFQDDEPTVSASDADAGTLSVDDDVLGGLGAASAQFAALFTANFGADGPNAADVVYSLSAVAGGTGVYDCATDQEVQLKTTGGTVVGYVTIAAVQTTVFTVSVDGDTGEVTLTLARAIRHLDGGLPTDDPATLSGTDLISLIATVKDGDVDTAQATADITAALSFEDAQPTITTPADINIKLADGQTKTELFTVDFNNDVPGTVTIDSFTAGGAYLAVQQSDTLINFYDDKGTPSTADDTLVYHVTVSNTGYTVTVDDAGDASTIGLDFNAIKAGGPQEILTVPLFDASDSIVFDGLLNGAQAPGDGDYLNPDSLGFGIKNGQASQINPGESFVFSTLSGQEIESLNFDMQGIGGIKSVRMNWQLWDDGPNGIRGDGDDILVDSGTTGFVALPSGNNVVHVSAVDDGAVSTAAGTTPANTTAGETFDYGLVYFDFPAKNGVVSANQGIRVLDFSTTLTTPVAPDSFTMTLVAEDCDGDLAYTNLLTINLDPAFP